MKLTISKTIVRNIVIGGICVALAALCIWVYPRHVQTFKYNYEVGKPWAYESLIADKTFPIYKTETQLQEEYADVLQGYVPYYKANTTLAQEQIDKIMALPEATRLSQRGSDYLRETLAIIYHRGVLSATDFETLTQESYTRIALINEQRISHTIALVNCYTPRAAYSYLIDHAPMLAANKLRALNLDQYIVPNLTFDDVTSAKVREDLLASVAKTEGVVEAGVKIVDRGEIVSETVAQQLNSLRILFSDQQIEQKQYIYSFVGNALIICSFILLFVLYLGFFRRQWLTPKHVLFFVLLIGLLIALTYVTLTYTSLSIYVIPFAWVPILVRVFYDARTAFMAHLVTILLATFMVPNAFEFLIVQIVVGLVVVSSLQEITQRGHLMRTVGIFVPAAALIYTIFTLATLGDWQMIDWKIYISFLVNGFLIMFAYGLIYFCEKAFGFLSSITLVELTNANSNLMMDFARKAPGTFQHSMQVSDLVTEAARKIGANVLLVRTGALYHDIGKMAAPQNFIENQSEGENPLANMAYEEAAQVIIRHVEDGVNIAKKYKLPEVLIRFIRTHHGTSKTRYFYNSYRNAHPDEVIDDALFTYPGPRPESKEAAILMMADAVEARSRSLGVYTEESISQMVEQMINEQIADGQFKDTYLSFRDVEDIKAVFIEKLININHHRIVYPELTNIKA